MPLSAPASLGRPRRPESFIPGPDTCGNAPWPSATPTAQTDKFVHFHYRNFGEATVVSEIVLQ